MLHHLKVLVWVCFFGRYTAGAVGATGLFSWIFGGFRGSTYAGAALAGLETGVITIGEASLNFALVSLGFEIGVGIGSMINVNFIPCEEETTQCKSPCS